MKVRFAFVPVADIKGKLVRCPGYSPNKVALNDWCWVPEISRAHKPMFLEQLKKSVDKEGVRNPIVVYALPEGDFLSFGGSRLTAAKGVGLEFIPALVNDHADRYRDCPEVTPDNVEEFFIDVPKYIEFNEDGVDTHYSLEKNRRHQYDPAGLEWAKTAEDDAFLAYEFSWLSTYRRQENER